MASPPLPLTNAETAATPETGCFAAFAAQGNPTA
jgi:hypothetical protein